MNIKTLYKPSETEIVNELKTGLPFKILGRMENWKCMKKWDNQFFYKNYGEKLIHVKYLNNKNMRYLLLKSKMKDYIDRYLFKTKNPAIVLLNNQSTSNKLIQKFFVFRNNKWNNALPEEIEMYSKEIKEIHDDINANLADIYGFITPFKKNDELVYKIKTRKTSGNVKAQKAV